MNVHVIRSTPGSRAANIVSIVLVLVAATLPVWAPEQHASSWMREFVEIA